MSKKKNDQVEDIELYDEEDEEDDEYDWNGVPVGCSACGGDYPNCTTSCPMFDD